VAELERLPPDTELVSASFPCTDVSRVGGRAGIDGAATGLVRHVFRLLGDLSGPRVPWVLLENVCGLLDKNGDSAPAIAFVVDELERLGYSWAQRVVASAGFGIPQRRRRVFIVASRHGDPRDVLLAQNYACLGACAAAFGAPCAECAMTAPAEAAAPPTAPPATQPPHEAGGGEAGEAASDAAAAVAAALAAAAASAAAAVAAAESGVQHGIAVDLSNAQNAPVTGLLPTMTTGNCRMALLLPCGSFGLLRIQDAERLQGLPPDWTEPAAVLASRVVSQSREGVERRYDVALRWGLVGNAVCVNVGRWLGERLRAPYAFKYVPRAGARPFGAPVPDTWPRVAWNVVGVHGGRHRAEATEAPLYAPFPTIGEFVRTVGPPPSAEAVAVWAGRMRSAGWTIAGALRAAMDALLASAPRGMHGALAESAGVAALPPLPPAPPPPPDAEALERSVFLRDPGARRMCWAKYAAFPWWPGLVVDLENDHVPERTLRAPGRGAASLLVVFFGDGTHQWVRPECVIDFAPHFGEHAAAPVGRARTLFMAAVAEAKEMCDARDGRAAGALPPGAAGAGAAGVAGAAASLLLDAQPGGGAPLRSAEAVALLPSGGGADGGKRCGDCRTCRTVSHRACLLSDARRLAAAGHAGAALTVAGDAARGVRIEVFWPLDERYYSGEIMAFDAYTCHHKIMYDDDESETAALWKETVACGASVAPRATAPVAPAGGGAGSADRDSGDEDDTGGLDEGNWDHARARAAAAARAPPMAPAARLLPMPHEATPMRTQAAPLAVTPPAAAPEDDDATPVPSPMVVTPDTFAGAGGAGVDAIGGGSIDGRARAAAARKATTSRGRARALPARLLESPPPAAAALRRVAPAAAASSQDGDDSDASPAPRAPARAAPSTAAAATAAPPLYAASDLPAKRRRIVNYAALCSTPQERPGSTRCAACKTQKKGTCGTPTASRLCLNRTPDMPLRKEANRRGGSGALFHPYRPAPSSLPVLPPNLPPVLTMPWSAGVGAAPPASALRMPQLPLPPPLPSFALSLQPTAYAHFSPQQAQQRGAGMPRARRGASPELDEQTVVPWRSIPGYVPPPGEA
jgi:site-specific DNA-cytosine methylase